jgi:putative transposase
MIIKLICGWTGALQGLKDAAGAGSAAWAAQPDTMGGGKCLQRLPSVEPAWVRVCRGSASGCVKGRNRWRRRRPKPPAEAFPLDGRQADQDNSRCPSFFEDKEPQVADDVHGIHSVFMIHLHIVWVTKYRNNILIGDIAVKVRELIREICENESVEIIRGHVSSDHVHLFLSIMPKTYINKLVQSLKGKISHILMMKYPSLLKQYWGRHMWARGYFCCSSGNVTDDIIKQYLENQNENPDDDFTVE